MEIINRLIQTWTNLCLLSIMLIFLRSDFFQIKKDVYRSVKNNLIGAIITITISLLLLPVTIPFSLKNILNKIKQHGN